MLSIAPTASPFARSEQAAADLPATQKAPLDRFLSALPTHHGISALILETDDSAPYVDRYLSAHVPPKVCAYHLDARGKTEIDFLQALCATLALPPMPQGSPGSVLALVGHIIASIKAAEPGEQPNCLIIRNVQLAELSVVRHIAAFSVALDDLPSHFNTVLIGNHELQKCLEREASKAKPPSPVAIYEVPGLSELDTIDHIRARLGGPDSKEALPFELDALKRIHAATQGLPEKIDLLCERAWKLAQEQRSPTVTGTLVASLLGQSTPRAPVQATATAPSVPARSAPVLPDRGPSLTTPKRFRASRIALAAGAAVALVIAWLLLSEDKAPPAEVAQANIASSVVQMASDSPPMAGTAIAENGPELEKLAAVKPPSLTAHAPTSLAEPPLPIGVNAPAAPKDPSFPSLTTLNDDTDAAWASLGLRWGLKLSGDKACTEALEQGHQCFRQMNASLEALRALDRPGLVQLRDNGVQRWVQITQWKGDTITLTLAKDRWQIPTAEFKQLWTGRFTTLWRQPMDQTSRLYVALATEPAGRWLDRQLQKLQTRGELSAAATTPAGRIAAFQKRHGLPGEGKALPTTIIRVNQLTGVTEPKLSH